MTVVLSQEMLDMLPYGISYLKPMLDHSNEAQDFVFLGVNSSFESLTRLHRKTIVGAHASDAFNRELSVGFDWIFYINQVLRTGKTQETVQRLESLGHTLHITVVPSAGMVALIVQDAARKRPGDGWPEDSPGLSGMDSVLHFTHDAISIVVPTNDGFRYVWNNAVHKKVTGFNNIEGLAPADLLEPDVATRLAGYYEQCVRTGKPVTYEQTFCFAPGKRIWRTTVTPIYSHTGLQYLLCSSKDISRYVEAMDKNEALSHRLRAMFDQHGAIMMLFDPDSGRIVDINPAGCRFYGYSKDEMLDMPLQELNALPVDFDYENRQSEQSGGAYLARIPHRRKNGEQRWMDIFSCFISSGEQRLRYSILFDATDREDFKQALLQEKEVLQTTLRSIGDGVVTTDNEGKITSMNDAAQKITGWDGDSAVGKPFGEVFLLHNEETGASIENPIQKVLQTGSIVGIVNHTMLQNRRGQVVPISHNAAPILATDGTSFGVVMVFRDVGKQKEFHQKIKYLSDYDSLTGLFNRRYVEDILSRMDSPDNLPFTFVMGDVNGLKITNYLLGHEAGDNLLRNVAALLRRHGRKQDCIARWGGDEFVILMPGTDSETAERIIASIKSQSHPQEEGALPLSMSFGYAVKKNADQNFRSVMRTAEENMYHQKLLEGRSYRNSIISTLLATLYEKSTETEEHSKRLEENCHAVGRSLMLSSSEMDELSLLAILHDIGKIGINPDILKKPASLTPAELEEMRRHPEIGYRIVQSAPELANVAEYILFHHERWDGAGYPQGLRAEEIPLLCRILAVADAYDAMTNDRPYHRAISHEAAIQELIDHAGTQFDPLVVRIFVEIAQTEHRCTDRTKNG